jgi:hypothetical protein
LRKSHETCRGAMNPRLLLALGLLMLPCRPLLFAQAPSLTVNNVRMDREKLTIDFDVSNQSAKAIHSWLITVSIKAKNFNGDIGPASIGLTSESCGDPNDPLESRESRRCVAPLQFPDPDISLLEADVQIAGCLFEDGTAEGDLVLLDWITAERKIRLQTLRYWQDRYQEAGKEAFPLAQLRSFDKMLFSSDPAMPADLRYDSTAMREQKNLQLQVTTLIQAVEAGTSSAARSNAKLSTMFEQRIQEAGDQVRVFPAREKSFAAPVRAAPLHEVENLTSGFQVARAERELDGTFRLVLRNYYEKEIVEYALSLRQAGNVMLISKSLRDTTVGHAIAPGTASEIRCGVLLDTDPPLEISAVIFRDGTADGDPAIIQALNDSWAGHLVEMARALPLLRALARLPESEIAAGAGSLIADLSAKELGEADFDHSVHFAMGMRQQRQALARELKELTKQDAQAYKLGVITLIRRIEERLRRN